MTNQELAQLLRHVAASYTIKNENKYRFQIIAYQRAADAIENSTSQVKDLLKEDRLELLPGIGPSIQAHIKELFKTGNVKHFNWVMQGVPQSLFPLLEVPTLGPKKAFKLVTEFKLKNPDTVIDDLEKIAKQGKIAELEGFGEKSQEDILRAVSEYKKGVGKTTRMVLPFAAELAKTVVSYLKKSKDVIDAEPLGSLRRKKETVGDVDIAVSSKKAKAVIDHFVKYPYIDRVIEKGTITASILASGGKQIDLMILPAQNFGSLLQHFTGSKNHNVHLREFALKKGYSLSEKGIKKLRGKQELLTFDSEEKFYKFLGLSWIPPEIREDTGEIELAAIKKLPKLVELSNIKGDLHIHSSFPIEPSHDLGKTSMEEMLEKAKELGYEYIGFSEHNPSISKHNKDGIYSILSRRKRKIEQLNSNNKNVRVISLLETDILSNGDLAIDGKSLSLLDATLVSVHSSFSMNKDDMTKRVITGLSHKKARIFCHPTGRLLNQRPGYEIDWEKLFDFCVKNNKALEINSWPYRLDLPDSLVREAIKHKVKFVINTDSHDVSEMDLMEYGVSVARRGWAQKDDILNTLPYNQFIKWTRGGE